MSFFKKFLGLLASFGFIFFLFTATFVAFHMMEKTPSNEIKVIETSMYLSEDIDESIWHEENNTIYLMILYKKPHNTDYYLSYAYHYYDTYNKAVHLIAEDSTGSYFITINEDGISSIN